MLDALLIVAAVVSVLAVIGVGLMVLAVNRAAEDEMDATWDDVPEAWSDAAKRAWIDASIRRARAERERAR